MLIGVGYFVSTQNQKSGVIAPQTTPEVKTPERPSFNEGDLPAREVPTHEDLALDHINKKPKPTSGVNLKDPSR